MSDDQRHEDEPPTIKVTDRRLFDSQGNLREQPEEPAAPAAVHPSDLPAEAAAPAPPEVPTPPVEDRTEEAPAPPASEIPKLGEDAVMRFIEEQYIGGLLALGAMPEPQSGQMVEDLDLAQVRIEVLGILQERIGPTLPADARKGVEDVLYQLRMAYLQKRKVVKL